MQSVCIMKLSYRKQIARQLHTQYVEGIYSNSETFIKLIGHWRLLETAPLDRSYTTYKLVEYCY